MPRAVGSTTSGSHRSASTHGQPRPWHTSGDQQECIDGKPLAQFWAQVAQEQRTKVGMALHAVRQEMLDAGRPCASCTRTLCVVINLLCSDMLLTCC